MSMFHELMMKKKGMPSNYQEVEYIESTGTQYIDTGIYGKNTTDYEIKWNETGADQYYGIIGSRVSTSVDRLTIIGSSTEVYVSNYNGSTYQTNFTTGALRNLDVVIKKTGTNLKLLVDGTEQSKTIGINQNYQTPTTLKLGCIDTNGTLATFLVGRIYYCKLYDNNRLVRNFIPVYDTETQKYGMWESVQGKFYGNNGTGDFKGSIVGYTVVGSPTITDGVVSGFTTSDYVKTPNFPLQPTNFEIVTRIKDTITTTGSKYFVAGQSRTSFIIGVVRRSSNTFAFVLYGGNETGTGADWQKTSDDITIDETKFFDVKFTYNGTEYALYVNGVKIISHTSTTALYGNAPIYYGLWNIGGSGGVFVGEIDLNNTYIKINNKLWFNGQQA